MLKNTFKPFKLKQLGIAGAMSLAMLAISSLAHANNPPPRLKADAPEHDILARLWQKLVINAGINAFTAILDCPNGEILTQPFYLQWIAPLCEEISRLLPAAGQPQQQPPPQQQPAPRQH